ncbi:MAG: SgcJ/EcaC family oxidoreductase [Pseudorhodoferax sp.]
MVTDVAAAQAALDQVVADWNQAGSSWNARALGAVYTADGLLFGGRPGHSVGRASIEGYFASYDGVILAGTMHLSATELRMLAEGCVLAQGSVEFAFTLAGGEQTRSNLRATLVLRREPDRWRIADHHFSPTPAVPPLGQD